MALGTPGERALPVCYALGGRGQIQSNAVGSDESRLQGNWSFVAGVRLARGAITPRWRGSLDPATGPQASGKKKISLRIGSPRPLERLAASPPLRTRGQSECLAAPLSARGYQLTANFPPQLYAKNPPKKVSEEERRSRAYLGGRAPCPALLAPSRRTTVVVFGIGNSIPPSTGGWTRLV
jgi:hypothetical protein